MRERIQRQEKKHETNILGHFERQSLRRHFMNSYCEKEYREREPLPAERMCDGSVDRDAKTPREFKKRQEKQNRNRKNRNGHDVRGRTIEREIGKAGRTSSAMRYRYASGLCGESHDVPLDDHSSGGSSSSGVAGERTALPRLRRFLFDAMPRWTSYGSREEALDVRANRLSHFLAPFRASPRHRNKSFRIFDHAKLRTHVEKISDKRDPLVVHDIEFTRAKRRRNFIFRDFYLHAITDNAIPILSCALRRTSIRMEE